MRGARRIDVIEDVQHAAALQDTVDGSLWDGDLVHGGPLFESSHVAALRRPTEKG
jgi:hypothetical protein